MPIDPNQMVIFAAVVREGSFTAAARALGQPKSTVSKRVADLEARLGVRLLHRSTRRLRPTDEGQLYYERCRRVVAEAEAADQAVADRDEVPRGLVRVTAPVALGPWIAPVAHRFLWDHPDVSLELSLSDHRVDLVAEGFDLALRAGPMHDSALVARRLGATRSVVCGSPEYFERRPPPSVPADLVHHDCVTTAPVWTFDGPGEHVAVPVGGRYRVSSMVLAHEGARAGLGLALLARIVAEDDLRTGRLVQVLADWPARRGEVHLLYASGRRPPARVRVFADLMIRAFAAGRSGLD